MRRAKPNDRPADLPRRVRNEVELVLGQRKLLQRLVPGLMHAFIFWGFLVLFPTILMAMIAAVGKRTELPSFATRWSMASPASSKRQFDG